MAKRLDPSQVNQATLPIPILTYHVGELFQSDVVPERRRAIANLNSLGEPVEAQVKLLESAKARNHP